MAINNFLSRSYQANLTDERLWLDNTDANPESHAFLNLVGAGGTLFGLHQLGKRKFSQGTGYDYLLRFVRGAEEYSPGRILRTFWGSNLLSPLESASQATRFISPEAIVGLGKTTAGNKWLEQLSIQLGTDVSSNLDILEKGLRFENNKLFLGKTDTTLLESAFVIRNPGNVTTALQEGITRSAKNGPWEAMGAFKEAIPFINQEGKALAEPFMIIGGKSRLGSLGKLFGGYGTALLERFNQLASNPVEAPGLSLLFKKIPGMDKLKLGVTPSSGLKTLGSLFFKFGVLGGGLYLGYQQLNWALRSTVGTDITQTVATAGVTTWKGVSTAAELTGLHDYREAQEEIAPGSTSLTRLMAFPIMGGLAGVGYGYANRLKEQAQLQLKHGITSIESGAVYDAAQKFFRENLGEQVFKEASDRTRYVESLGSRVAEFAQLQATKMEESRLGGLVKWVVAKRTENNFVGKVFNKVFGSNVPSITKTLGIGGLALGTALVAPFIPGALIPSERPDELERIYSGKQLVPIRKGRWWELGRSSFQGENESYYRPSWYTLLMTRAREKAIWGEDEPSPISKFFLSNFTTYLEEKNYWTRPYPQLSPAFSNVPFIGPILGATIGSIIKPPMLMHEDEWQNNAGEALRMPLKYGERLEDPSLGEIEPSAPISRYSPQGVLREQLFNFQNIIGLPGFTMSAIKENITGTPGIFDDETYLASSGDMVSTAREFYDLEAGDPLSVYEGFRRMYPRYRANTYNPIPNAFINVDWLPGPGQKGPDLKHSDPYAKIPMGEIRLPGIGFEILNPEVKGLDPNDYPLIYQYKILADVARYSESFERVSAKIAGQKKAGQLSDEELEMYRTINEQIKNEKQKKEFDEYKYRGRSSTAAEEALARLNEDKQGSGPSIRPTSLLGSYWETLAHNAETPLDYLTPVSPGSKLVHMRTAIEDYQKTQIYGTSSAFWQNPVENFIEPFASSLTGIKSGDVDELHSIEQYFDILEYVKSTALSRQAEESGNYQVAREYEEQRRETLIGINPYTQNYSQLYRALPRRERDYFSAFTKADMDERSQIYGMIPANERAFYKARWLIQDVNNWRQAAKKGELTTKEESIANQQSAELSELRKSEGFPVSSSLLAQYNATKLDYESYADWYRRTQLIPQMLEQQGAGIPGPSWIGWTQSVSLEDVKLKIVENIGESPFDYDIWPDQVATSRRRPYLQGVAQELSSTNNMSASEIKSNLQNILTSNNMSFKNVFTTPIYGSSQNEVQLTIEQDRTSDIQAMKGRDY